jgi:hypothetical protein
VNLYEIRLSPPEGGWKKMTRGKRLPISLERETGTETPSRPCRTQLTMWRMGMRVFLAEEAVVRQSANIDNNAYNGRY